MPGWAIVRDVTALEILLIVLIIFAALSLGLFVHPVLLLLLVLIVLVVAASGRRRGRNPYL